MKIAGNIPKGSITMLLLIAFFISCGTHTTRPLIASPNSATEVRLSPLQMVTPRDTVHVELTDKQKLFYQNYFLPQFTSLRNVIDGQNSISKNQATSISLLTQTLQEMRQR